MTPAQISSDPTIAAPSYAAFSDNRLVATGAIEDVLRAVKKRADKHGSTILIFEEASGRQVDFDMRGSVDDVLSRVRENVKPGPGRPKLGVISREVSLLPRHWDWLENQRNGASAAIRRLVDEARHNETGIERGRHVRNGVNKFLWSFAGDFPNFEEVARAIDAREDARLDGLMSAWPKDVRAYVFRRLEIAAGLEGW
jgi:uncharacterized protein